MYQTKAKIYIHMKKLYANLMNFWIMRLHMLIKNRHLLSLLIPFFNKLLSIQIWFSVWYNLRSFIFIYFFIKKNSTSLVYFILIYIIGFNFKINVWFTKQTNKLDYSKTGLTKNNLIYHGMTMFQINNGTLKKWDKIRK